MMYDDDIAPRLWLPIDTTRRSLPNIPEPGPALRRWVAEALSDYPEWGPERISAYIRFTMGRTVSADQVRYVLAVPED